MRIQIALTYYIIIIDQTDLTKIILKVKETRSNN